MTQADRDLVNQSAAALRRRCAVARQRSQEAIERSRDVIERSLSLAGDRTLGPAPYEPIATDEPRKTKARCL
jgi:hypothetical protein